MCPRAEGVVWHGAMGAAEGGVSATQEAGGGPFWGSLGSCLDLKETESGHQDAQTRWGTTQDGMFWSETTTHLITENITEFIQSSL